MYDEHALLTERSTTYFEFQGVFVLKSYGIISGMFKKRLAMRGILWVVLFYSQVSSQAAEVSKEAEQELSSQVDSLRRDLEKPSLALPEKPEIHGEEPKKPSLPKGGPRFILREIRFEGNTIFDEETLRRLVSNVENREISFVDLGAPTQAVTELYRSQGYTTSYAYVHPQTVEGGVLTVTVFEGKIGKISVEGNRFFKESLYRSAIRPQPGQILRYQDLERSISDLNRRPDRTVKAYLLPGKEPGTSDVLLKVEETSPFHAAYEFHNRGTKLTHRGRHLFHLDHNNLRGEDDILNLTALMAEEGALTVGAFAYTYPMTDKATAQLSGVYSESMLIGHLKPSEVKGESLSVTPAVTYAFVKSPAFTLEGDLAFEIKDSKTLIDDHKSSFDRMRVVKAGPRIALQDASGMTWISPRVHWGVPLGGGSEAEDINASRVGAGGDFVYGTLEGVRLQRFVASSILILRAGGQWADETLTSVEQFRLGGASSVRGYPESDSAGDRGYNFSIEWNIPPWFLQDDLIVPFAGTKWRDSTKLVVFLDGGKTFLDRRPSFSDVKDRFLLGAGAGLRFYTAKNLSLTVDFGFPIGDDSSDEKNQTQVHLSLRAGF